MIWKIRKISSKLLKLICLLLLGIAFLQVFRHTSQLYTIPKPHQPVLRRSSQKEWEQSRKLQFFQSSDEHTMPPRTNSTGVEINFKSSNPQEHFYDEENETEQDFMRRMETRMHKRRQILHETCSELGLNPAHETLDIWSRDIPRPRPWMYLSEKYRFMYIEIPKSGCTNWKKIVMVLKNIANFSDFENPKASVSPHVNLIQAKYTGLSLYEKALYRNITKFLVVREPMERLASAYIDKVAAKPKMQSSVFSQFSWEVAKKYGTRWKDPTKYGEDGLREISVCAQQAAELSCKNSNERIKIVSASYGRINNQSCGGDPTWNGNHCYSTQAYFVTSQLCDGKSSCVVASTLGQFGAVQGCIYVKKILTILYKCQTIKDLESVTVCSDQSHEIKCPSGGVISIASAFFGRTNKKTCSFRAVIFDANCDCPTATSAVISACNHESSCVIHAKAAWIQSDSCPHTSKYLQVWYSCVHTVLAVEEDMLHDLLQVYIGEQMSHLEKEKKNLLKGVYKISMTQLLDTAHRKSNNTDSEKPPKIYRRPPFVYRKYPLSANFSEFVSYLLDPENLDVSNDVINHGSSTMRETSVRHWKSYHSLTYPCHIDYDVIIHMETIDDDAKYFFRLIGAPLDVQYPKGYNNETGGSTTTQDKIKNLFSTLSKEQAKKLLELYSTDYRLFGYDLPTIS